MGRPLTVSRRERESERERGRESRYPSYISHIYTIYREEDLEWWASVDCEINRLHVKPDAN